jgi:hypothetical protein
MHFHLAAKLAKRQLGIATDKLTFYEKGAFVRLFWLMDEFLFK